MSLKVDNDESVGTDYVDDIVSYMKKNRLQTFYNLVLLVVILIQTPFMIAGLDSVTVEVDMPPRGTIVVRNDKANELYYRIWTEHFLNNTEYYHNEKNGKKKDPYTFSIVDFDYLTIENKMIDFLKFYNPSKLIEDKIVFQNFIKNVKTKMISQNFFVENIKIDLLDNGHKALAIINGVAYQKFGITKKEPKTCSYKIAYSRKGGKVYVESLTTSCF